MKKQFQLLLGFALLLPLGAFAQKTVEVVTKSIQKSMPFEIGSEIIIDGQKADVYMSTWDKNRIAVYLDIVASHPDKAQAEADLENMDYELEKKGAKIYIKNFVKDGVEKTASQMEAKYTIILPASCPVNLSNVFGSAQVRDLSNALVVDAAYCTLKLTNLRGRIDINTSFGDIEGHDIVGQVSINSSWTDMKLSQAGGDWKMNSSQGVIKIDASSSFANFDITADQSEIYIEKPAVGLFNYEFISSLSEVNLPQELQFQQRTISQNVQEIKLVSPSAKGSFRIKNDYGKIVVFPLGN